DLDLQELFGGHLLGLRSLLHGAGDVLDDGRAGGVAEVLRDDRRGDARDPHLHGLGAPFCHHGGPCALLAGNHEGTPVRGMEERSVRAGQVSVPRQTCRTSWPPFTTGPSRMSGPTRCSASSSTSTPASVIAPSTAALALGYQLPGSRRRRSVGRSSPMTYARSSRG